MRSLAKLVGYAGYEPRHQGDRRITEVLNAALQRGVHIGSVKCVSAMMSQLEACNICVRASEVVAARKATATAAADPVMS